MHGSAGARVYEGGMRCVLQQGSLVYVGSCVQLGICNVWCMAWGGCPAAALACMTAGGAGMRRAGHWPQGMRAESHDFVIPVSDIGGLDAKVIKMH